MDEVAKKKWARMDAGVTSEPAAKSAPTYSREYDHDAEGMARSAKLAEQLTAMQHAHQKSSVSNRTIRNTMYGVQSDG